MEQHGAMVPGLTSAEQLDDPFARLVGQSEQMQRTIRKLQRVAPCEATVLLHGESGTGKSLVAEAIHRASPRRARPFVALDCLASLFRPVDGTLGDAATAAFARAAGGTVFLDKIEDLDPAFQPHLLRLLERHQSGRLGTHPQADLDVRFLASTTRDLAAEVQAGRFRADLYYRLGVISVRLPPLRDRHEDMPTLCRIFLDELSARDGTRHDLPPQLVARMAAYPWRGNVRELRNVVENLVTLGSDDSGTLTLLDEEDEPGLAPAHQPFQAAKAEVIAAFEKQYLHRAMLEHANNITAAAASSGVHRVHFLRLLDRHGLRKRPPPATSDRPGKKRSIGVLGIQG